MVASYIFRFPACNFIKKETPVKMFSVSFAKFLRASFDRTPPSDCFFSLFVNFGSTFFSEHLFYRTSLANCSFDVQVAEFQPVDTAKSYFTGPFQAFYKRAKSSYLNAFIYLNSLKIIYEEINL